jgi:lipopolysaccharide transport system permease protein
LGFDDLVSGIARLANCHSAALHSHCVRSRHGSGFWLAALTVKYRDFRYVVPFIVQFGLYISPVGFTSSIVPLNWRLLYSMNPMVAVIDGFRWALFGGKPDLYWPGLLVSSGVVLALLVSSVWYFRRVERTFADVI